jgi:competence protein ComEC
MNWWILKRRPHVSWLIAILSLALLIGIFVARFVQPTIFGSLIWCIAGVVLIVLALWRRYIFLISLLIVGGIIIGLWRGSIQNIELSNIEKLYNKSIIVTGSVREDVDTDTSGHLVIRLDKLTIKNKSIAGMLWVSAKSDVDIKRSDHITIEGKVSPGFGSFAGTMYQARVTNVKRPQPGDVARVVRDWFADGVRRAILDPQASLGIGYLVGQKRALPADLVEALQIAGLTHVVVASGYNLTILVRLARRLFIKVSKYLAALSASLMIAGFVAVTGLSPSMSRAGLVAGLSLAAWYYGRRFHPLVLLSFAAAVTVVINPSYIWGDLGWQLSFAAFAGVMILAPLLQRFFFGDKKPGIVRQILGETISAVIVTAPVLVNAFGQFSNIAIIANLLILPFVPLAMLLTFIAGVGALLIPPSATVVGLPATLLLGYMTSVAQYLSHVSWAVTKLQISEIVVGFCYVILAAICVCLWRATKLDLRDANIVE